MRGVHPRTHGRRVKLPDYSPDWRVVFINYSTNTKITRIWRVKQLNFNPCIYTYIYIYTHPLVLPQRFNTLTALITNTSAATLPVRNASGVGQCATAELGRGPHGSSCQQVRSWSNTCASAGTYAGSRLLTSAVGGWRPSLPQLLLFRGWGRVGPPRPFLSGREGNRIKT